MFHAYAATEANAALEPFDYDPGDLHPDEVEIEVSHCGLCHSDLSMIDNEWGMSKFPLVPGHEVVGKIVEAGEQVKHVKLGDRVGLGWQARSCMHCDWCLSGNQSVCAEGVATIVGRHGGFADRVRCHHLFALPVPEPLPSKDIGPLLCGGITVFKPLVELNLPATAHVGVIGIGGLGHLALQFADRWGCHVTAFSTTDDKEEQARQLGADDFYNSKDKGALKKLARHFDLIISTAPATLNWTPWLAALKPTGRLCILGMSTDAMQVQPASLIMGEKGVVGSAASDIVTLRHMLDFAARHDVEVMTEQYPMTKINDAIDRLRHGDPRYRVVLAA